jgi:hypothetical protein
MKRRVRDPVTKRRSREQTDVDCNEQQVDYCNTYHQIDKGNGAEAKYDLSTESHLHGWGPKLAARYFNRIQAISVIGGARYSDFH